MRKQPLFATIGQEVRWAGQFLHPVGTSVAKACVTPCPSLLCARNPRHENLMSCGLPFVVLHEWKTLPRGRLQEAIRRITCFFFDIGGLCDRFLNHSSFDFIAPLVRVEVPLDSLIGIPLSRLSWLRPLSCPPPSLCKCGKAARLSIFAQAVFADRRPSHARPLPPSRPRARRARPGCRQG